MLNTRNKLILGITVCALALSSCVKKDPLARLTQVLLVPLSPNAAPINFSVNGDVKATQVNYSSTVGTVRYTLPYYTLEPKAASTISYNVQTTNAPFASITADLNDDKVYSTFLIDSASKAKAIIVNDDLTEPNAGYVKLRFFNFCPNDSAVNVFLVGGSTTPIWSNRAFETQATATARENFLELPAGTYSFEIRNATSNTLKTTISSQVYLPERIYTLAARGFVGGTGNQAISGWLYPNKP
jgi:hypothetical protein